MKVVSPVTLAIQMPSPSRFELFPVLSVKVRLMPSPTMLPVQTRSPPGASAGSGAGSGSGCGAGSGAGGGAGGVLLMAHGMSLMTPIVRVRRV